MKFCPECGVNVEGMKFCPECGYKIDLNAAQSINSTPTTPQAQIDPEITICEFSTYIAFGLADKKAGAGSKFEVSLPQEHYKLTNERLIIERKGMIKSNREEIDLFEIKDISVKQSVKDKMMGVGDLTVLSNDSSTPRYVIKSIKDPQQIADQIKSAVRSVRKSMNVVYRKDI